MARWDAIVLGLGAVGAFALRALAQRGARVLGLDLDSPAHERGSSHGHCRIFRHAYFEHADYVPLLRWSTADFERLERECSRPLLHRCGVLLLGARDSEILRRSAQAAAQHGVPVEALDQGALRRRFPWFAADGIEHGLFEPDAGLVRPEAAIAAAVAQARRCGAEVRLGVRAQAIGGRDGYATVATAAGELDAKAVVLAAGAWTDKLLPETKGLLAVTRQVQAWIAPQRGVATAGMPCWLVDRGAAQTSLYGIPSDPLADNGSPARAPKVAFHGSSVAVDPDLGAAPPGPADLEPLAAAYREVAPALAGAAVAAATCLYTMSPDGDFLVGTSRELPRVHFAAGLSGHGFKLAPALGHALADLALEGSTQLPIGFLSPRRTMR